MVTVIIPDIHLNHFWIEDYLNGCPPHDEVVFLGDYFHNYENNTPNANAKTAIWLKESLDKPSRVHLIGNHDQNVAFPNNPCCSCSGGGYDISVAVNDVMGDNWNRLKPCYFTQGWFLSHAGVSEKIFGKAPQPNAILEKCQDGLARLARDEHSDCFGAGFSRGGPQPVGGVTWLDWNDEFEPVEELRQIVGHTKGKKPRENKGNWCIDTDGKHIGIIIDGVFYTREVRNHLGKIAPPKSWDEIQNSN